MILNEEKSVLDRIFKTMRGNDLLQVGGSSDTRLISQARVLRSFFVDRYCHGQNIRLFIQADPRCLPVQTESMDIVLLMHTLESSKTPKAMLDEAYRVLRPNGQLIIFGVTRWSLWQISRLWMQKKLFSDIKKLHSLSKIKRLLYENDFEIVQQQTMCFRPLFKNKTLLHVFLFLEALGQFFMPYCGGIYMIHAIKNIPGMTPLVAQSV